MRGFVTFTLALLLVRGAAAQDTTGIPKIRNTWRSESASVSGLSADRRFDREFTWGPTATQESTCWFIRSYIFERKDRDAPVLKGETICTPSNWNSLRQAKKRSAHLVPLGGLR
jgi:hypothetical protein